MIISVAAVVEAHTLVSIAAVYEIEVAVHTVVIAKMSPVGVRADVVAADYTLSKGYAVPIAVLCNCMTKGYELFAAVLVVVFAAVVW